MSCEHDTCGTALESRQRVHSAAKISPTISRQTASIAYSTSELRISSCPLCEPRRDRLALGCERHPIDRTDFLGARAVRERVDVRITIAAHRRVSSHARLCRGHRRRALAPTPLPRCDRLCVGPQAQTGLPSLTF